VDAAVGLVVVLVLVAAVGWFVLYRWDGGKGSGEVAPGTEEWGEFLVRMYGGRAQREAIASYVQDAEALAQRGYAPVGQGWGDGQWDGAYFLLALVLSPSGIGLILLAYMAIIRPDGTLCITYRLRAEER